MTPKDPVSAIEALTLLFLGLKLSNQIDWSWWFVFSPVLLSALTKGFIKTMSEFPR